MSKHIKVGDLVMVTKPTPCCGGLEGMGYIGRVESIVIEGWGECTSCHKLVETHAPVYICEDGASLRATRVIKIDPPPLEEDTSSSADMPVFVKSKL